MPSSTRSTLYLLGGLKIERPNQVWGVDITYIRLRSGWLYLFAVLDWYSRFVVSWKIHLTLEIGFVLEAMRAALATATPVICNSDQGSHFTSPQYIDLFRDTSVHISMDGKGHVLDTVPAVAVAHGQIRGGLFERLRFTP